MASLQSNNPESLLLISSKQVCYLAGEIPGSNVIPPFTARKVTSFALCSLQLVQLYENKPSTSWRYAADTILLYTDFDRPEADLHQKTVVP